MGKQNIHEVILNVVITADTVLNLHLFFARNLSTSGEGNWQ